MRLRTDDWVTAPRARAVALAVLLATVLMIGALAWEAHGTVDAWGRPLGTDFSNVWTAGWMADHGQAASAWDWSRHHAVQRALHGPRVPFYGWHYPPPFLLVAALFALLPYLAALILWQGATLTAAVAVACRIVPGRTTVLVALGFPAVLVCLGHGQNGFLTAALLGGGLLLLARRPVLAGVLIGCLCYKPQFAPVLPVAMLVGGHWRAIAAAGATVMALVAATTAIWGVAVWHAFAGSLALTRTVIVEQADTGAYKIVSAFAAVRLHDGPVALAYAVQAVASTAAILGIVALRAAPARVRYAAVATGSLLATPYAFDYDTVVIGVAIAFLVAEAAVTGWRDGEKSVLALAYLAPLVGRATAQATGVPLNLLAIVLLWVVTMRRGLAPITPSPCRR
ncbi:glycosyltransferase family 87 protein [Sphingomonas rubra]|uniref:DUF2029 domain-containing protein n=1 Tax=Sphingomonas rubra TaxID=634430 RepID=A0A1I5Q0J0_9SPHN|nr:glycosyltransferase family 87 protein [Sphingomonas rubra]SFP39813.1 Protein of unknown function [Sphingomonas rubra]